jgi:hypothetical protein
MMPRETKGSIIMNAYTAGYKSYLVIDASWVAIKDSATQFKKEHGRWPTHIAMPRDVSKELGEHIAGTSLRSMGRMVGQGGGIILGYDAVEHPVKKTPSWMMLEFEERETLYASSTKGHGEVTLDMETLAVVNESGEVVDDYFDDLKKAGEIIYVDKHTDLEKLFAEVGL